jgi:hypothetical protein
MKQADKDYRYMAISDLYNELQKDTFKMDADSEKKIVRKLLEMVALDKAAEVRAFAVKWYVESSERAAMYSSLFLGCTKKKKSCSRPVFFSSLPPLVKKVHEEQAIEMFDKLATYVYEEKDEQVRDVAGSGLRTMIDEFPEEQLAVMKNVLRRLAPRLIAGVSVRFIVFCIFSFWPPKLILFRRVAFCDRLDREYPSGCFANFS